MKISELAGILFVFILLGLTIMIATPEQRLECTKKLEIKTLLEHNYRTTRVLFEDGSKALLNQASVKPGDVRCITANVYEKGLFDENEVLIKEHNELVKRF